MKGMKELTHAGTVPLGCPVERSSMLLFRGFKKRLRCFLITVVAALREIFDESAYTRFLNRRQLVSSRATYAAFCQEQEVIKARRPRCC